MGGTEKFSIAYVAEILCDAALRGVISIVSAKFEARREQGPSLGI